VIAPLAEALDRMTRVGGVWGALLVAADDGLVIAEAVMEGIKPAAIAALAASLARQSGIASEAAGAGAPRFLHLQGAAGTLAVMSAGDGLLLVAVGSDDMNVGLARLEMLRAIEAVE
jgi:predicted regulator of Ras-like GTPase activity (Roadblock/LC7/MglB family)